MSTNFENYGKKPAIILPAFKLKMYWGFLVVKYTLSMLSTTPESDLWKTAFKVWNKY